MNLKAIKIRLYPTVKQQHMLNQHFGCCRFIYNNALNYKMIMYNDYKVNVSKYDIIKQITDVKKENDFHWLNEVKAECLQNTIDNLESAYKGFFKGSGFPKFKNKKAKQSFVQKQNFKILEHTNKLVFLKKKIKFKCSKQNADEIRTSKIKRIIYSKDNLNNYYASILIEFEPKTLEHNDNEVGIDLGLKHFLITSDGEFIDNPKLFRKSEKKLVRQQRKLSRTKKGSNNRNKQRLKVGKIHKKISNQRNHFLHQISNKIINENQIISLETLIVKNMIKNHNLAKSIQDASWSTFVTMLIYKADWYDKEIKRISTFAPSSKTCSNCGWYNPNLTLKDRTFICKECDYKEDRDINASKNILNFSREELPRINASGQQSIDTDRKKKITDNVLVL